MAPATQIINETHSTLVAFPWRTALMDRLGVKIWMQNVAADEWFKWKYGRIPSLERLHLQRRPNAASLNAARPVDIKMIILKW